MNDENLNKFVEFPVKMLCNINHFANGIFAKLTAGSSSCADLHSWVYMNEMASVYEYTQTKFFIIHVYKVSRVKHFSWSLSIHPFLRLIHLLCTRLSASSQILLSRAPRDSSHPFIFYTQVVWASGTITHIDGVAREIRRPGTSIRTV